MACSPCSHAAERGGAGIREGGVRGRGTHASRRRNAAAAHRRSGGAARRAAPPRQRHVGGSVPWQAPLCQCTLTAAASRSARLPVCISSRPRPASRQLSPGMSDGGSGDLDVLPQPPHGLVPLAAGSARLVTDADEEVGAAAAAAGGIAACRTSSSSCIAITDLSAVHLVSSAARPARPGLRQWHGRPAAHQRAAARRWFSRREGRGAGRG